MPSRDFKLGPYYKYMVADRTEERYQELTSPVQDRAMPLFLGAASTEIPCEPFVVEDVNYVVDTVLQADHHLNPFDVPLMLATRVEGS